MQGGDPRSLRLFLHIPKSICEETSLCSTQAQCASTESPEAVHEGGEGKH